MKFVKLWLPVIVWCYIIYFLSDIPGLSTGLGLYDLFLRKLAHIMEFFILTLLLYRAFRLSFRLQFTGLLSWSAGLSFLYAVSDEYHQTLVLNRCGNVGDLLIDSIGIAIAVYIFVKKSYVKN